MSDNITVKDVVRLFAGDGRTITQNQQCSEGGPNPNAPSRMEWGSAASRRTEAMQAIDFDLQTDES